MEVKEKYETPMMEMIEFNREEVVTMSVSYTHLTLPTIA